MRYFIWVLISFSFLGCSSHAEKTVFDIMFKDASSQFKSVIKEKDTYEIQILFSPISRLKDSVSVLDHFFNYRPGEYFYPASTVKMPVSFLALQKLEELKEAGIDIDRNTPLRIDSLRPLDIPVVYDSTNVGNRPTIAHYIEKVFSISDNDAFNRLYEFCGSDYINGSLKSKGIFTTGRVVHRLGASGYTYEENKFTPQIHFLGDNDEVIFTSKNPAAQGFHLSLVDNEQKGKAFIDSEGNLVKTPFNFKEKNFINITDLQESLKRFIFPELYFPREVYDIDETDREFVFDVMQRLPREFDFLKNQTSAFYDGYGKFLLFGDTKDPIPDHIEIRNKVGMAYGYLTDCAYIKDTKENIEYFLTATILVNENQTFNDGVYEYDEVGIPFLAELGRLAHSYMIQNK